MLLLALLVVIAPIARAEDKTAGFAAAFLISQAAERNQDWPVLDQALADLTALDPTNDELAKQQMYFLLSAGQFTPALALSARFSQSAEPSHLVFLLNFTAAAQQGDSAAAQQLLDNIDEQSISHFIRPFLQAWVMAANGTYDKAVAALESVEPIGRLEQAASFHTALIADLMDKPEVARAIYSRILIEQADTRTLLTAHGFYARHGLVMQQAGLGRAALRAGMDPVLQAYLATTPTAQQGALTLAYGVSQVLYDLAALLKAEGAHDLALPYVRLAQQLQPQDASINLMLAELLSRLGQTQAARELLANLTTRPDVGGLAAVRLATLELGEGRFLAAQAQLDALHHRFPSWSEVKALLGDIALRQQDMVTARQRYTLALDGLSAQAPPRLRVQLLKARVHSLQHTHDGAQVEADLQAALALAPDDGELLNHLGYLWAEQGVKLEQAEAMLQRALAQTPDNVAMLDSLGWILHRRGQSEAAIRWLELASELAPYNPTINDHLGDAYWAVGRQREARFQWQRALTYHQPEEPIAVSLDDLRRKLEQGLALQVSAERH